MTYTEAVRECLENGDVIDMKFLSGISNGETRLLMSGERCVGVVHRNTPKDRYAALGGIPWQQVKNNASTSALKQEFIGSLELLRNALGLAENTPLPPVWTADFILDKTDSIPIKMFFLGEINAMAVGHTAFPEGFEALGMCFVDALKDALTWMFILGVVRIA